MRNAFVISKVDFIVEAHYIERLTSGKYVLVVGKDMETKS